MSQTRPVGWTQLAAGWPWFRGEGRYPLPGYSEFNPPPRLVRKPYGTPHPSEFATVDPHGWPVTEYEEALELRPGLHETASELMTALAGLGRVVRVVAETVAVALIQAGADEAMTITPRAVSPLSMSAYASLICSRGYVRDTRRSRSSLPRRYRSAYSGKSRRGLAVP
jgi:hypothetical protein